MRAKPHPARIQPISLLLATVLVLFVTTNASQAADLSRDIREGRRDDSTNFYGVLEVGFQTSAGALPVVGAKQTHVGVTIGGHLRYRRLFFDFLSEGYHPLQFGFNLHSGPTWSFDLIATGSSGGVNSLITNESDEVEVRSAGIDTGLRVTAFTGPYIAEFEALRDSFGNHDGSLLTGTVARQYLWRNWNLHWLVGARYHSADTTQFLFGIEEEDATDRFPRYTAGAGVTYVTEFGATKPINEHVVFRGTARYWSLPDSIARSPYLERDTYGEAVASIVYVF